MSADNSSPVRWWKPAGQPVVQVVGNAVLALCLVFLLIGVLSADREGWPSFVGDEATYLMAAESLAWDFDLLYDRGDYDRFVEHWETRPEGLILQSGDHGGQMTFSKPFFFPAFLAPFVRLAPQKGVLIANVLLLALAAFLAAKTLKRWVGPSAPLWIAVFLFASTAFLYAYWAHADLFLLSLSAISLSLVFSDPEGRPTRAGLFKWALGGILLAIVAFSRPFYVPLLIPAAFCAPRPRLPRLAAFWGGVALLILGSLGAHRGLGDSWTSYDGERATFYGDYGFPEVEVPRSGWDAYIFQHGNFAWNRSDIEEGRTVGPRLWGWNAVYFAVGRHVGVFIYFMPLILGLAAGPKDHPRWALAVAIAAAVAGAFFLRPFNFFGGGASVANRYFLPLYPAFWFLAGGPLKLRWLAGVSLVSALFMWPIWTDPGGYVIHRDGTYRFVSSVAEKILPYETSQSHLKPAGQEDLRMGGLWMRMLSPEVRTDEDRSFLTLERQERGSILIGRSEPTEEIELIVTTHTKVELETNAELLSSRRLGEQQIFRLKLGLRRARHAMWWPADDLHLYRLDVEFDSDVQLPIPFILRVAPAA